MSFYQLFPYFAVGVAIKRKEWLGYWKYNAETMTVEIHSKDGSIISLVETQDILFTLSNIVTDDWEIATNEKCTVFVH